MLHKVQYHNNYKAVINIDSKKESILLKSILVGILAGIVTCLYRIVLTQAEEYSFQFYALLRAHMAYLPLVFAGLGLTGYFIGMLTSKYHMIGGSGIPQVRGLLLGYFKNSWLSTLIAKFLGGAISILAGLSLGREGPSIQLGACVAQGIGDKLANSRTEKKILIASGASAGLAAAFNAPLAGTMFALEEIFKYFSPVILLSTMVSAIVADFISKLIFGTETIFHFTIDSSIPLSGYWYLFLIGATLGAAGAFYNYILVYTQKLYKKAQWLTAERRPVIPFVCAGIIGLVFPMVLGGGHHIIGELQLENGILFLLIIFSVKFLFSMISFGSGAPGGIFFPLLILGSIIGAVFGNIAINYLGFDSGLFYNFVVLAMAGYFTAIVRAPITGVILLIEMTGSFHQLLSLTVVSVVAFIVADLLKSKPIYETLLENMLKEKEVVEGEHDDSKRITIEMIVHHGAPAEGRLVKELELPRNCLLIAVKRRGKELIPKGDTKIMAEDYLVFLTSIKEEANTRECLRKITSL
ncbi:ClC family H(+)/Cl(-) exchange transporter [Sinanaerobacter chloroacetimidivorans]|jgi:H+/Cl- antiporter ClcA|uniref:ClC family H(+)/Cl(-) exchange transporter n=1 Tax=Sinanaerobacter chloroacetimidivorans TaxID=2818044 RepID=A0A8J8B0T2_9FIRM|nr:ClC family H(+)/Cl(-) exchange transporter [Sinanaerobacter chloroacetimidivorans]MBR0597489.1 ClC family H(+)/Cl(-) exchange transporter [Sinanaerobacter chloroacetimidivorans]